MRLLRALKYTSPRLALYSSLASSSFVVLALFAASQASASPINHGNYNIPSQGISFNNVTESSGTDPVPMFNAPSPFVVGLDFNPTAFTSVAVSGGGDATVGQLNFTIKGLSNANGLVGIDAINLFETGDYSLVGGGGSGTAVFAGVSLLATITEIDGVAVAPFNLPTINDSFNDSLPSAALSTPWSLGLSLNVAAGLIAQGYPASANATQVDVAVINTLISTSEPGSVAVINKSDLKIDLGTEIIGNPIPEPTAALLAAIATGLIAMWRRQANR